MDYPAEIAMFTVTGKLMYGNPDTVDAGIAPDLEPVRGAGILFEPEMSPPIFDAPAAATVIYQRPVSASTDVNGQITGLLDSSPDVMLPYYPGQTWRVTIEVADFPTQVFSITGSPGGTVNIASVVPVPPDPGTDIIAWEAIVSQVTDARDDAVAAAAAAALSNPGAPNGTAQLDAGSKLKTAQIPTALTPAGLATTITAHMAARLTVNVKDYGALGNGVADDRASIQAALDAAGTNGTVYFPPGTYLLATMTIASDRILKVYPGQAVTGQARNAVTVLVGPSIGGYKTVFGLAADATNPVRFSMWGITVDQNCDNGNAYVAADASTAPRNVVRALSYVAGSLISINQCSFLNSSSLNTLYIAADTLDVSDNLFLGTGPTGLTTWYDHSTIYTTVTQDGGTQSIRGNTFRGKLGSGGATTAIETHGGAQVVTDNNVSGYQIGANLTGWSQTVRVESIVFAENAITRAVYGVQVWSRYAGTITTGFANQGVKIVDNNITLDRDAWNGITGLAVTSWGITVEEGSTAPISGLEISRNTIRFAATALTTVANDSRSVGIRLAVASSTAVLSDVDITDNTIINALSSGMTFSAVINRLRVARNTVIDPAQSTHSSIVTTFLSFASITGTLVDADFDQNVLVDTRGTHKCVYMFVCQTGMTSGVDVKSRRNKVRFTDAANPPVTFYPSSAAGTAPYIDDETTVWPGVFQPAKAGSIVRETSTGKVYKQVTVPTGTTWKLAAELGLTTGTTAPSAGAGSALPATPAGYATVSINGTDRQVAYY